MILSEAKRSADYDFFQEQPVKNASVYLLRIILHDWSDEYAMKILKRVRAAASPDSKLIVMEAMLQYACASGNEYAHIPGAVQPPAPAPLLANFGVAKDIIDYYADFVVRTHSLARLSSRSIHVLL